MEKTKSATKVAPANLGMASVSGPNGGLLAKKLDSNGSAAVAGVRVGDEVVTINGKPVDKAEAVAAVLAESGGVGATVAVRLIRDNAVVELPMLLKKRTLSLEVEDVAEVLERKISP
ncbi:MAG: PDZ domain-containing protein [Kofleriaceae bacterium]